MFGKIARLIAAPLLAVVMVVGLVPAAAFAGEDSGMCKPDHGRVQIPGDFPLNACFDGKTLYVMNNTQFPLNMTLTGNNVASVERYTRGSAGGASMIMAFIKPSDFGRTPVINAPESHSGLLPPGYYVKASIGGSEVGVKINTAGADVQRMYVVGELVWRFLPTKTAGEVVKAAAELVRELADVGDQYVKCRERNNAWGDVGCSALMVRNVSFAYGRAAVSGLAGAALKAIISLFDTTKWADAATGDLLQLRNGRSDFKIATYVAPAQPTTAAPKPPATTNPGGNSGGGGNPQPTTRAPEAPKPQTATATVQNMHLVGGSGLAEDTTPSYLSTVMQPRCANSGCKIGGTDMWSGDTFTAICWATGAMMTNENRNTAADDANPNRVDTDRWLRGVRNGQTGYISYIYVTPGSRNLSIPHC